jgi:hypothetical protein
MYLKLPQPLPTGSSLVLLNCRFLATIITFVIQNLTQYIHWTSSHFKNHPQVYIDSRSLQLMIPAYEMKNPR